MIRINLLPGGIQSHQNATNQLTDASDTAKLNLMSNTTDTDCTLAAYSRRYYLALSETHQYFAAMHSLEARRCASDYPRAAAVYQERAEREYDAARRMYAEATK